MKLSEFFRRAIRIGMENDPRGMDAVREVLDASQKEFESLKDKDREFFDSDSLSNPYPDSRVLYGTGDEDIRSILLGIDIESGEVLLGKALRDEGRPVDALVAHHPEGRAYAKLYEVMAMQADILGRFGVPINAAESLLEKRITDVERKLLPVNHTRAVDTARLLGIPMLNLHTPADNMVASYLQRLFDDTKPATLGGIMDLLMGIEEYRIARKHGAGPKIFLGSEKRKAGRVLVDMTGGTEGSKDIFPSLVQAGINTVVGMHFSEDHRKEAEKSHLNMVIAGHISSDNLGLNLLLDQIEKDGPLTVYECSGFRRVKRS